MTKPKKKKIRIGVVDYGMGNLHSVEKALAAQGGHVVVSDSKDRLKSSDLLVLPGVGSFGAAMKNLAVKKLDDFIRTWIDDRRPYLGICLGLQLLFEKSEEDPGVEGLSALKGKVVKFRPSDFRKGAYCVPHMGWNTTNVRNPQRDLLKGIRKNDYFYFVHTFYPVPEDKKVIFTETQYGKRFCSAVATPTIFATQFHLEKSGGVGLQLLSNAVRRAVN